MGMNDDLEIPDDIRLYVVGDIHGRSDLLDQIVDKINRDIEHHGRRECLTITLGDYVDRGPDSRGVLERLCRNPFPTQYVALRGNHEELFETFLHQPSVADQWRRLGGLETLHSYGIPTNDLMLGRGFEEAARALSVEVPEAHQAFLASLKTYLSNNDLFFCHAGVRPDVPLDRQNVDDLLSIRDEFLSSKKDFGKMIIHGHSPNEWPQIRPNRINIDTGAFATGRLTCLVIEGNRGRFLFTG
jgi:serine/threonine protein phosphatase 1